MPETGDPRHPSSFKPQKTPAPLPNPANLNHGEQKGGGQSEQKHPVQSLQSTQELPLLFQRFGVDPTLVSPAAI
jgi:hypothetical protein